MLMRTSCSVAALLFLFLFPGVTTEACTCAPLGTVKTMREFAAQQSEGINASKVLFEGVVEKQEIIKGPVGPPVRATSMTTSDSHRVVTIHISRTYRGKVKGLVTLLTGSGIGDCGFDFRTGKEYLVYADNTATGYLFTSICSGTMRLEQAGPALRFLRNEPPSPDDLLDPQSYYRKYLPQWTGRVCGRVLKSDGSPLGNAQLEMSELREEPLLARTVSHSDLSKTDGTFCVGNIFPGKYVLSAQDDDYDANTRWMGFYPGVVKYGNAVPIEVKAGVNLTGLEFRAQKQYLYNVYVRIVTSDGSRLPWQDLGIAIDSADSSPFGYHERHGVGEDGSYTLGLIPPGRYFVHSVIESEEGTSESVSRLATWQMAEREIDVREDTKVVLRLVRRKSPAGKDN